MSIGEKVRELRKALDLTQKEFAAKVPTRGGGIYDWSYIGKIERDDILPSIKYLQKIGEAHGKPLAWFFQNGKPVELERKERRNAKIKALACLLGRWNWELTGFRVCRRACEQMPLCRAIKVLVRRE